MLRTFLRMLGRSALCGAALLTVANLVQAQVGLPIPQPPAQETVVKTPGLGIPSTPVGVPAAAASNEEKARIERLEKQVQDLTNALKSVQAQPAPVSTAAPQSGLTASDVRSLIDGYYAEQEGAKKAEQKAKAAEGYKVGTDLKMSASWQNGVMIETPNKDFYMRAGFRFQWDNVWFRQDATNSKAPPTGIGKQLDGDYWRRLRPNFSGGFWEVGEFNVEMKLENLQNGTTGLDDVWVGVKGIPFIGTVRLGHFHMPHGLEADMYSSSKPSTFFEVYSGNAAFYQGERCASGVLLTNTFWDKDSNGYGRMTYAFAGVRPDINDNGTDFANGDYEFTGRLTGLPIYQNDGRCLLHIGASATWRHVKPNVTTGAPGTVTFSTDAQLRDRAGGDNGFGNNTNPVPAGFQPSPGNKNAWISTGAILASSTTVFGPELLYIHGPFSLQAEYDWAFINSAVVGGKSQGNLGFTGGYVQLSYFLTGENRTYDKRQGRLGGEYIAKANTPFWLVKDENGGFNYGLGAWELAARFSRLELLDPVIKGGILDQWEFGVNWHLNNNMRLQFMYLHANRFDIPGVPGSWMNGFGIRTQFTF